eukprot:TRINITY_DN38817_c0_g1_i1.p1 TRINITY_DN38817_c0_g1~~TRINITY_DN38817_c0_g1_i1.p1  ORF type:complete len:633 (+),score=133.72 TRINITY_DN38817_c0_g1_i1:197-1900(+)
MTDDLESPQRTYNDFPKLDLNLFYKARQIDAKNIKGFSDDDKERLVRIFTTAFNTSKVVRRGGDKRMSSMTLNLAPRGFIKKEQWAEHLLVAIYGCWFILEANTVEHLKDKQKAIDQSMQMLNYARTHRLEPDELIYCHALIIMAKTKQIKYAEAVFEAMRQAGIQPSAVTYNAYATALADGNMGSNPESVELARLLNSRVPSTPISVVGDDEVENLSDEEDNKVKRQPDEEVSALNDTFTEQRGLDIDFLNIQMSAMEKCPSCNSILPDAEVMAGWGDDIHDYTTQCVACQTHRFVPNLRVKYRMMKTDQLPRSPRPTPQPIVKKRQSSFYGLPKEEENKQEVAYEEFDMPFPYLNPLVLRKEVESLVRTHRRDLATPKRLRIEHPFVFWNLLWYFAHQEIPLDCILGEDLSENVRITPLEETKSEAQTRPSKKSVWNNNMSSFTIEQIEASIKSNDLPSALRMFLRNRLQCADDPFWQQGMFRHFEETFAATHTSPTPKVLQDFLNSYKAAFGDLPPDLLKVVILGDRAPGTSVRAFRNVFGHEEFYRIGELTYIKEIVSSEFEE